MLIFSYENLFSFAREWKLFSLERMSTRTRFEKEAKKNGELNSALIRQMNSSNVVLHRHYGVIRLQLSFSFRSSFAAWCFCCFNSFDMANFEQERENRVNFGTCNQTTPPIKLPVVMSVQWNKVKKKNEFNDLRPRLPTTNKTRIFENLLLVLLFAPQISKGVYDDTKYQV